MKRANKDDYAQMRLEFNRESSRKYLKEQLGNECANCGSSLDIEYHHVVPLALGGRNKLTNIIPLCHVCHQIAHGSKNIRHICRAENTGRPKNIPKENYKSILRDYIDGKIGRKEAERLLGLPKYAKLSEQWYFSEYLKECGIEKVKNSVDLIKCGKNKNIVRKEKKVSEIIYINGDTKTNYRVI